MTARVCSCKPRVDCTRQRMDGCRAASSRRVWLRSSKQQCAPIEEPKKKSFHARLFNNDTIPTTSDQNLKRHLWAWEKKSCAQESPRKPDTCTYPCHSSLVTSLDRAALMVRATLYWHLIADCPGYGLPAYIPQHPPTEPRVKKIN